MTEYQLTLRDGSKRFEVAQDIKEVRLLLWMHDGICAVPVKKADAKGSQS